ncbi:hypothetical protein Lcho_3124 [Leptothrix cholodnii SP-6]|uniref:Uncharacterized protein n=1 Tax=Leptothrix cholodnii (strain ATCC 51168 / LMG 8142 / SP-6) TaxID=395495 RepID=B1Y0W7_LEPCP|nr:hypothetical protein Lcho_3124 [Leptothrix cholodnii SP-6]
MQADRGAGRFIHSLSFMKNVDIDPLDVQFGLAHDCIRACIFADHIQKTKPKASAWPSLLDMCYSDAIMSWNAIFGTDSQDSHWKNWVAKVSPPKNSPLRPFHRSMIVSCLNTTETAWMHYHQRMTEFRNKRLAHFVHAPVGDPPNITWALHSACLYREWLISLVRAYQDAGFSVRASEKTGQEMLEQFRAQIAEICI